MKLPLQVDVIIFYKFKDSYKYLMMQRNDDRGGFWQPVTGGVEDGESILEAAKREVSEEAGYKNSELKRVIDLDYSFQFKLKNKDFWITEYVFAAEASHPDFIRLEKEHQKVVWSTFDEAMKLLEWDTNKETLKKLHDLLKKEK
jgi:dATP pyrophosphohydrolase